MSQANRACRHLEVFLHDDAVEELVLVDRTVRPAFARRPVVGDDNDHRVVKLANQFQKVDQAPDLIVGLAAKTGINFSHSARDGFLVLGVGISGAHQMEGRLRFSGNVSEISRWVDR
jgi:hypothetical protein